MAPVYLIDASVYIFRAWFALPDSLVDGAGRPVNAAYGFAGFLCDFLDAARPRQVALAFDESLTTCFRNDFFPAYKANRESAPPELKHQFGICRRLAHALGLVALADARFEADDIIGTLASRARANGGAAVIVSRDKDLTQLLCDGDALWDYAADTRLDGEAVRERFGVDPVQMPDYLGLVGDPVDNIPGVVGIGARVAAALLSKYDDLESIFANLAEIETLPLRGARRIRRLLEAGREQALLSRRLARICTDVTLPPSAEDLRWRRPDAAALELWCREIGAGGRLRARLAALARRCEAPVSRDCAEDVARRP